MANSTRETAGVTTRLILGYARQRAGDNGVDRLLRLAGERRSAADLEDEATWSTYAQKVALFEAAAVVCDDQLVARRIGESVLREQVGIPIRMILWTLGSPAQVYRNVARAAAKFSTAATLTCETAGRTSATVTYRLHAEHVPSRHDCEYTHGLLSQAPALFGLDPADVDHRECQARGAEQCVFHLNWARRSRLRLRQRRRRTVRYLEAELQTLMAQVESLERATSGLVVEELEATLRRIAAGAGAAVRSSAYQMAVLPLGRTSPFVQSVGLEDDEAERMAIEMLDRTRSPIADESLLVVDVASSRRFYGRLAAVHPAGHAFFPEERRLLTAYAGLTATALDAAACRDTATVLLALAGSLADLRAVEEVCARVVSTVPQLTGSTRAAIGLWDQAREITTLPVSIGLGDLQSAFEAMEIRLGDTPELARMLEHPELRTFASDATDPFISSALEAFGIAAVSAVPVVRLGEVLGFVLVGWEVPPDWLDDELVLRLNGLGAQAATAIDNARLFEQTTHRSLHDALTGLPNRTLLQDRVGQALARARRQSTKAGILLLDLDDFKAINDSYGHAVGDLVLQVVATRLTGLLREADTAARLGGDEFVVICQEIERPGQVAEVAQRVVDALNEPIDVPGGTVTTGASVGWVLVNGYDTDVDGLLGEADRAMYRIKRQRSGRGDPVSS